MKRRLISLLLIFCILLSTLPASVLADAENAATAAHLQQLQQNSPAVATESPAPTVNWHPVSQNSFSAATEGAATTANPLQEAQNQFTDVSKTDWFYDAVMYVKQNGIFSGTGSSSFSPYDTMTRAMYVTVLGRTAGIDISKYSTSAFSDVTADKWYGPYVAWAVDKGITAGTGYGHFSPEAPVTREQMAALIIKCFESYGIPYETDSQITSKPKDISDISPWARDAVLKLWRAGFLKGDTDGNFRPGSKATRAEAAALSMHIKKTVKSWSNETQPPPVPAVQPVNSGSGGSGGNGGNSSPITYTLTFNTNGGNIIDSRTLNEGTTLNNLPTPYKLNAIFLGWYKDSGFSASVSNNDTLKSDMTLYAKYAAAGNVSETQNIPECSKLDQAKNFTISVEDSTRTMTADQVKAAMTFESPSNPDFSGIIVTGSGGHFTVAAQGGAFEEGGTYKLTLNDKNLSYTGEDKSTTIYTFTIAKQDVMNVSLNSGLVYIPASDVHNMTQNGSSVSTLSVPLASVSTSGTDLSTVDLKSGTFEYDGTGVKVGDAVAIYKGTRPDQRTMNTSDIDAGTVAYVSITAINGNVFTYRNADSKDVLFTPDILPVNDSADTDGDSTNHSITVSTSVMDYSGSNYAQMGLNASTTVDAGDFIAFYTGALDSGSSAIVNYGKITGVSVSAGKYTITYADATQDQVTEAMELYKQKDVDGKKLLENADVPALETQIEHQAVASGFVNQASEYLAALAMDTDNFKKLDGDFDLKSYNITLSDGTPVSKDQIKLMGGLSVKVKNQQVKATLSSKLQHFSGLSGVRCDLNVSCDVVISGEENDLEIHLSAAFAQEVRIKLGVSGGAVWKWKWIFPYIADYRINASVDAYTFTGISINATIRTQEQVQDISKQIKDLMDNKDKYNGMSNISGTLQDKYAKMLETDSDWVDLVSKNICNQETNIDGLGILWVGFKVDFVVSAKVNVSIGCDFYYENAKRYIFSLGLFSNTRSADTVNLVEEHYQFDFYVMGTLGLRAGLRLEVSAGLFSLKLDSVGFIVEVGAYVQLWGYFYYELSYTASGGHASQYSGALLFEVGIYLEIDFHAQVLNDKIKYKPTLYENQWPLWSAGSRENVYDFSYSADSTPKVSMAKQVTSLVVPDSTFSMNYMDMKTGETDKKIYDDAKDFTIQMTNSDFTYDTATNKVTVKPGSNVVEDGSMIITWKSAPVAFTSTPISRTVLLHWEDLKNSYSISFDSNGGSAVGAISLPYNSTVKAPADPQKIGYVFGGWYKDQNCTQAYSIPLTMPAADAQVYAKWTPATNTKYTVEHYQQNLVNDLYTLADTDNLTGTTGKAVSPVSKTYTGYTAPVVQSITITADGSAVLRYYYTRNSYTLTYDANGGAGGSTAQVKYGATIAAPTVTKQGYAFAGWSPAVASKMPDRNTTYTAQWTASNGTAYKVEHYQQNITDNNYTLVETENLSGVTNATATAVSKSYTGFTYDSNAAGTIASGAIAADGSLTLKLYYTRNSYTLTYDANGGAGGSAAQVKYGATIAAPAVTKQGYAFAGWSPAVASKMPDRNTTYTAQWTASNGTAYKVEHYQQNITDNDYTLAETENLSGVTNATATAVSKNYTGFTYDSHAAGTIAYGAIAADGSLTLKLYYTRNSYTLTFNANGGAGGSTTQVKYGATIATPEVTNSGYTFTGWSPALADKMPAQDTIYTAQWTASNGTAYKVEHYQQNITDNDYTLAETENLSGVTNAEVTAVSKSYTGFTYDSHAAGTITSGAIAADGSLTLKLYYTRNSYTLTFDANGGAGGSTTQAKYGATIAAPEVTNSGYTFTGWSPALADKMPAQDTIYTAQWLSVNAVSTLDELIAALADNSIAEVTVTQAIELTDGTVLDGKGKTVRAAITGTDADGNVQTGSTYNIFTIGNGSTVTIGNLTVKGGSNTAIVNAGKLTMNGVTITQSGGTYNGGGGLSNTGVAILKDCVITKNVADHGAGFSNSGAAAIMIMENSSVISNNSMRGGGGSENNGYAKLYLNNCTFSNNKCGEIGGAINNFYGTAYVLNSTITGNISNTGFPGVCGGGIGNNAGTLYVVNSLITNNFEQHSASNPAASDIGVYSNGNDIYLYNSYCGAYVTDLTDNLAVVGTPVNSISSTVNPAGNGLTDIFGSYTQWNGLTCPMLVKLADGTYAAPLAAGSPVMSGGCDIYFDYSASGVTVIAYGSTPEYLIGTSGGVKINAYQGGNTRAAGVIGAFGN